MSYLLRVLQGSRQYTGSLIGSRAGGGGGVGGMVGYVLRNTVRRGPQTLVDVFAITCDIEHKILPQDDSTTTY